MVAGLFTPYDVRPTLAAPPLPALIDTFLARCADPAWWTQTIAFTAAAGHVRGE